MSTKPESYPRIGTAEDTTATVLAQVARTLHSEHDSVQDTLLAVTAAAVDVVPAVGSAGVTIPAVRRAPGNSAGNDELARSMEALQFELAEGPSPEALQTQHPVHVEHVVTDGRWPRFTAGAAREDVRSVLAFPLSIHAGRLGVLTLYSRAPGAFGRPSAEFGLALAAHAAVAIASAQQEAGLRLAVEHRDLIGQAKGILMERHKLTPDQAFQRLVRASQTSNVPLYAVAFELTTTGDVPPVRQVARTNQPASGRDARQRR